MQLIDSHCHLDVEAFAQDREAVLQRAQQNGVSTIVVPGIQANSWDALLQCCDRYTGLYPALGLHPVFLAQHQVTDIALLEAKLEQHAVVAVGEIGLDYFVSGLDHADQQLIFEAQLELARNTHHPVILHVRKAHDAILSTLQRIQVVGGICHAFNGSLQQAQRYIELGFKLGFGGMLTFERSVKLRSLAKALPLESLVLETDAPDMTVMQHRGERNSPEYLPHCLTALADVREEDEMTLARVTSENVRTVLNLDAQQLV